MATLRYDIIHSNPADTWYTGCYALINYTAKYNADTNQTTVTFGKCYHLLWGDNGYYHSSWGTLTVTALDSGNSAQASMGFTGDTRGGLAEFECTPSPVSITVQHSDTEGEKKIRINGDSDAYPVHVNGNPHGVEGHGSVTLTVGTYEFQGLIYIDNGTSFDAYEVYIDNGTSWDRYIPYVDNGTSWDMCK